MAHTGDSNAMKEAALLIHQARHHDRFAFVLRHLQIAHERRGANGPIAKPAANFVHAVIQRPAPFSRLGIAEHIQLHRLMRRYKIDPANGQRPHGLIPEIVLTEKRKARLRNLQRRLTRKGSGV